MLYHFLFRITTTAILLLYLYNFFSESSYHKSTNFIQFKSELIFNDYSIFFAYITMTTPLPLYS
jgi:hypothetical protein